MREDVALDATEPGPAYPMRRGHPLAPPPDLSRLRAGPAATRVTLWDGSTVWLVTAYRHIRAVLVDRRFTAVTSAPGFPMLTSTSTLVRAQPGTASFIRMDDPDHARLRSMLTRDFLVRNAEDARPVIRDLLDELLDDVVAGDRPADLVAKLALPVPSRVIALLLGIPPQDREFFEERGAILIDRSYTPDQVAAARDDLDNYLAGLVADRMADPGTDLVSRLVTEHVRPGRLAVGEMVPMCRLLLVAGHGTTASQAGLSLLSLLTEPGLSDALRRDPALLPGTVDELLRFHSIVQNGLARAATEDVVLDDVTIAAGEGVVLALAAGNRDDTRFPDPDVLDPQRATRNHLAFGHGIHQCLGQWLARVELEEMLAAVLRRLPGARLAVPFDELVFRPEVSSYGLAALPVDWADG